MEVLPVSRHAAARLQSRAIREDIVDLLLAYGTRHRRHGADVYSLDRAGRARLLGDLGRQAYARLEARLDTYLVVSDDGVLITAAHRLRRLLD